MALEHNHNVRIAGDTTPVDEKQHAAEAARSACFPSIRNDSSFLHVTDTQLIEIDEGEFGVAAGYADSSCELHHQPGRPQPDDQRNPTHPAIDDAAEDQAGKRYGPGRHEGFIRKSAGARENDASVLDVHELYYKNPDCRGAPHRRGSPDRRRVLAGFAARTSAAGEIG